MKEFYFFRRCRAPSGTSPRLAGAAPGI